MCSSDLNTIVEKLEVLREKGHTVRLEAIGYADPRHTDEHNKDLSNRRAEQVAAALAKKLGYSGAVEAEIGRASCRERV